MGVGSRIILSMSETVDAGAFGRFRQRRALLSHRGRIKNEFDDSGLYLVLSIA